MVAPSGLKTENLQKMVEETNDIIEQSYYLTQKVFELQNTIDKNKVKISKTMGTKKKMTIRVDKDLSFTATKNITPKLEFYKDQLSKNLDKDQYNKVIDKTITINDVKGLVSMLKSYGVPPKQFKAFLSTIETVNVEKIDELVEIGDLNMNDLQGCYSVSFDEEIKIKKN